MRFAVRRKAFFGQNRPGSEVEIRYAPRTSTPQDLNFSERKRVTLMAEVGVGTSSNKFFSSELLIEPCLFSESSIPGFVLRLEAEGKTATKKREGSGVRVMCTVYRSCAPFKKLKLLVPYRPMKFQHGISELALSILPRQKHTQMRHRGVLA